MASLFYLISFSDTPCFYAWNKISCHGH